MIGGAAKRWTCRTDELTTLKYDDNKQNMKDGSVRLAPQGADTINTASRPLHGPSTPDFGCQRAFYHLTLPTAGR
jgi:hypothetical protein